MSDVSFCPYCGGNLQIRSPQYHAECAEPQPLYECREPDRGAHLHTLAVTFLLVLAATLVVGIVLSSMGPAVTLVAEDGVSDVSGGGMYRSGDLAYVSAYVEDGYTFLGWYSDDGIVSAERTFWFDVTEPVKLHALAELERMAWSESGTVRMESPVPSATGMSWKVTDVSGAVVFFGDGSSESCTLPDGAYSVTVSATIHGGEAYERTDSLGVGMRDKTFEWIHNWTTYSLVLPMSAELYDEYRHGNAGGRAPQTDSATVAFVTSDIPEISYLANRLLGMSSHMTDLQRANFVLKFVQSTDYLLDSKSRGAEEWFKYPYETLYDNGGDCEDTSILCCALMEAMGYDTVLLKYTTAEGYASDEGHMACAVAINGYGAYYTHDGVDYYFCETTGTSDVGVSGDKYDRAHIIHVD